MEAGLSAAFRDKTESGCFPTNQRHQILKRARVLLEHSPRSLAYGTDHLVSNSNICSVPACAASVLSFAIQSLAIRSPGFSSSRFSN